MESKTVSINIEIAIFNAFPTLTFFSAVYDTTIDGFICTYSFLPKTDFEQQKIEGKFVGYSYADIYIAVKTAKEKPVVVAEQPLTLRKPKIGL